MKYTCPYCSELSEMRGGMDVHSGCTYTCDHCAKSCVIEPQLIEERVEGYKLRQIFRKLCNEHKGEYRKIIDWWVDKNSCLLCSLMESGVEYDETETFNLLSRFIER